ncbi:MAG: radical SAM protein [Clostridia bacterium]|nr:radical SAM protein [Clostridia bacterium]
MDSIYTHDTIYIPPLEEKSAPLEVALGCSWAQCTFCDFAKDEFQILSDKKIAFNIDGLAKLFPSNPRIFLLGENAFFLDAEHLLRIFRMTKVKMPCVNEFAMYARADDILAKTEDDLILLKKEGLSTLHIGVESGSDSILAERGKGLNSQQMLEAFRKLQSAGIEYCVSLILGLGGRQYSRLHIMETARLLNKTHPRDIWCLKLHLFEGTPLHRAWCKGNFDQMSPLEILGEFKLLLQNLTVKDCSFGDTTVLDSYTVQGRLPEQKDLLLRAIDQLLEAHCV